MKRFQPLQTKITFLNMKEFVVTFIVGYREKCFSQFYFLTLGNKYNYFYIKKIR